MGKLLSGHYGDDPEAESMCSISLAECHQKLSMKPSDFVSAGAPDFFNKSYGAKGRYLLFLLEPSEVNNNPIWKAGYYLLPLEAMDVLKALDKNKKGGPDVVPLPVRLKGTDNAPEDILKRATTWGKDCQPLFFKCGCDHLAMKISAPFAFRRRWKAKLGCPGRCQPTLSTLL
jgi:hypothetical protein